MRVVLNKQTEKKKEKNPHNYTNNQLNKPETEKHRKRETVKIKKAAIVSTMEIQQICWSANFFKSLK